MAKLRVHVQVEGRFRKQARGDWMRKAANAALKQVLVGHPVALSVRVSDDAELHALNRTYRGMDKPTDVLSFGDEHWRDGVRTEAYLIPDEDAPEYLGDIVISFEKCQKQAAKAGHAVTDELALLVIHGVLHLLGHDHDTRTRKALMWQRQAAALKALGIALTVK